MRFVSYLGAHVFIGAIITQRGTRGLYGGSGTQLFVPPRSKVANLGSKYYLPTSAIQIKASLEEGDTLATFDGDKLVKKLEVCACLCMLGAVRV